MSEQERYQEIGRTRVLLKSQQARLAEVHATLAKLASRHGEAARLLRDLPKTPNIHGQYDLLNNGVWQGASLLKEREELLIEIARLEDVLRSVEADD